MAIRTRPKTPLQKAREELRMLRDERKAWAAPHVWGERYDEHVFAAKRAAHLAQLDPVIAAARAEVERLEAERDRTAD